MKIRDVLSCAIILPLTIVTGCQNEAIEFLNRSPVVPGYICVGPGPEFGQGSGSARQCGAGVKIFPGRISQDGSPISVTAGELGSFAIDTRLSLSPPVPGALATIKISVLDGQSRLIAERTFAGSIVNGIVKISDPTNAANWLATFAQAQMIAFDGQIDRVNETAGQTNSFVTTVKYLGTSLKSAGVIWSAPCYYDPDSGITSPNQCLFGGT